MTDNVASLQRHQTILKSFSTTGLRLPPAGVVVEAPDVLDFACVSSWTGLYSNMQEKTENKDV